MGGLKFGRKESVAVQIEGKEVAVPVGVMRMMIAAVERLAEGKAAGEQNHSASLPGETHQKPRSLGHRLAHPARIELPTRLIPIKVRDHQRENAEFVTLLTVRTTALQTQPAMREDFMKEMRHCPRYNRQGGVLELLGRSCGGSREEGPGGFEVAIET
jgi:hypothetical protein